ncbi:CBS domain-containing protein [Salirhabdus euzebyi]|uniref:CBS domain-containing protein n=1 Tax=Salirhabdus euzebyi TaxID=394506 RepID=A0A841Q8P3_9BACI|nr:CBS domain-containing protein [Salirhabdus euzebyi]MBB6454999.1 CBS domain-containing protein [Salirhabdus euzebyi]
MKLVRDIMTTGVECCSTNDNIYEAALKMKQLDVGAIPIVDENKNLLGIVTDRDLVLRGYANKKPGSTSVSECMSEDLYSVTPDTDLQEASKMMSDKQIRRLPVVENGKLTGIISLGDLALDKQSDQAAGEALEDISVPNENSRAMH